jgi:hypothetical protein
MLGRRSLVHCLLDATKMVVLKGLNRCLRWELKMDGSKNKNLTEALARREAGQEIVLAGCMMTLKLRPCRL